MDGTVRQRAYVIEQHWRSATDPATAVNRLAVMVAQAEARLAEVHERYTALLAERDAARAEVQRLTWERTGASVTVTVGPDGPVV